MQIPHYDQAQSSAVCFDLSSFGKLVLRGADRAAFLQNFTTNDIIKPGVGSGCETFVTTAQAKLVAWLRIAIRAEDLYLNMEPGIIDGLQTHLQKYLIAEAVEFDDRTQADFLYLLSGTTVPELTKQFGIVWDQCPPWHNSTWLNGIWYQRCDFLSLPAVFLWGARAHSAACLDPFASLAIPVLPMDSPLWNTLRVEEKVPAYGIDLDETNLPQESGRTEQAISFNKGCYIGQETVARIRAYGHVNRQLIRLRFEQHVDVPASWSGAVLTANEKEVGRLKTVAYSPRVSAVLALGMVRKEHLAAGSILLAKHPASGQTMTVTTVP